MLQDILIQNRLTPANILCHIKQSFMQITMREKDHDAQQFLWMKILTTKEIDYTMTKIFLF